jgi:post-segregation antitoxin (ccd killing protein)
VKQTKPNISIRFDAEDVKLARKLEIDLPELARKALKRELVKHGKKCPTCGQTIK